MTDTQNNLVAEPAGVPQIYAAMIGVMGDVTNVPKTGEMKNKKGDIQYNFVPSAKLRARLGASFRTHAVMLQSRDLTATFEAKPVSGASGQTVWTTAQITITYVFTSLIDGSVLEFASAGEGRDSSDKATAKAMTMALKSALSQAFMIATEDEANDDPDASRPEAFQDHQYAPPPPDTRTDAQKAAQEAYERRRAAQQGGQVAAPTQAPGAPSNTASTLAREPQNPPPMTRLTARQPGESDEQYLARLRAENATQDDYNQAVREMNQNRQPAAQVHPAPVTQAAAPAGDPIQQAEQMLADQLGARPVDEIGQTLIKAISEATRSRMAGTVFNPRDAAQRERATRAVAAAQAAPTLEQVDRVVKQAETEGLLTLTVNDKLVGAMIKAARDSRLVATAP